MDDTHAAIARSAALRLAEDDGLDDLPPLVEAALARHKAGGDALLAPPQQRQLGLEQIAQIGSIASAVVAVAALAVSLFRGRPKADPPKAAQELRRHERAMEIRERLRLPDATYERVTRIVTEETLDRQD